MRRTTCLLAVGAALGSATGAQAAEQLHGVTESGRLVSFASDSPGNVRTAALITGMAKDEHLVGLDLRPGDGQLFGIGTGSYVYRVARSGAAQRISPQPLDVFVQGSSFGLDLEPAGDRIRLVSDAEQNFRVDPGSGRVVDGNPSSQKVDPDRNLRHPSSDPGFGGDPNVGAAAYTAAGQLYGIDAVRDTLVRIDPPSEGNVRTVGPLGVDAFDPVGFDIARDGSAYATFGRASGGTALYRVNLATGRATPAARYPDLGYVSGRRDPLVGLTATGGVPDDRTRPRFSLVAARVPSVGRLLRGASMGLRVRCSEPCRVSARLRSRGRGVGSVVGDVRSAGGSATLRPRLTRGGRSIVRRTRRRQVSFTLSARDAAGNTTRPRGR